MVNADRDKSEQPIERCRVCRLPMETHTAECDDTAWHVEQRRVEGALERLRADYEALRAKEDAESDATRPPPGPEAPDATTDTPEAATQAQGGDERWADWHNAMAVAGLGKAAPDRMARYVTEALRLADAEHAEWHGRALAAEEENHRLSRIIERVEALIDEWDGEIGAQEDYQSAKAIRAVEACLRDLRVALAGPEPETTEGGDDHG